MRDTFCMMLYDVVWYDAPADITRQLFADVYVPLSQWLLTAQAGLYFVVAQWV